MKTIQFAKYEANGNTFAVIHLPGKLLNKRHLATVARKLCAQRTGVAADGMLTIRSSRRADFALDIFNADGSWAERSGNGLQAATCEMMTLRPTKKHWRALCGKEIANIHSLGKTKNGQRFRVEIGIPRILDERGQEINDIESLELQSIRLNGRLSPLKFVLIKIGNPHMVIPVSSEPAHWRELAEGVAATQRFPKGINVEFVLKVSPRRLRVWVWERGVGETESSGTGASAALVAMTALGYIKGRATVDFGRQKLPALWAGPGEMAQVTGKVRKLFTGEIKI